MKTFFLKVAVFVLILGAFDRCAFHILQSQRPIDYKYFLESKQAFFEADRDADILIFGDSHIADAVDTRTLEAVSGRTSYNLGMYHASPFEYYYLVRYTLDRLQKKPSLALIGTNPKMFRRDLSRGKYTFLLIQDPVLSFNMSLYSKEGIDAAFFSKFVSEKFLIRRLLNNLKGKPYIPTRKVKSAYNGHLEFYNQIPNSNWTDFKADTKEYGDLPQKQYDYLERTVSVLIENDIEVIIVNSPIWYPLKDFLAADNAFKDFANKIQKLAHDHQVRIFNPDHELLRGELQQRAFLNSGHLNYYGAKLFTAQLAAYMYPSLAMNHGLPPKTLTVKPRKFGSE